MCSIFFLHPWAKNIKLPGQIFLRKELVDAHSAEADVSATIDVFISQFTTYPQLKLC